MADNLTQSSWHLHTPRPLHSSSRQAQAMGEGEAGEVHTAQGSAHSTLRWKRALTSRGPVKEGQGQHPSIPGPPEVGYIEVTHPKVHSV